MGRLNYRLIASLFAGGIVLVLLLWPSTAELTQRKVRTISGNNRVPFDRGLAQFTSIEPDDDQIVQLLSGAGTLPVEVRAFGLAKAAASPAMWAHVIRNTGTLSIDPERRSHLTETDKIRWGSLAELELLAARSGGKPDPTNAFFPLSEATALARLGRWGEILEPLERAARMDKFDDYSSDEATRRVEYVRRHQGEFLASDLGREAAAIMLPHFSCYVSLADSVKGIENPSRRLRSGLALAQAGQTLQSKGSLTIAKLVGSGMVQRSINATAGRPKRLSDSEAELRPVVERLAKEAEQLGLLEVADGWRSLLGWKMYRHQQGAPPDMDLSADGSIPTLRAVYQLLFVAALGGILWFLSKVEPNPISIGILTSMLFAIGIIWASSMELQLVATAALGGSSLLFAAFLAFRLPGRGRLALAYGTAGVLGILISATISGQFIPLNLIVAAWAIPFLLSAWTKFAVPKWALVVLLLIGEVAIWKVVGDGVSSQESFREGQWDRLLSTTAMMAFWIPVAISYVMAWGKVRFEEALKLALAPIPFLALLSAVWMAWNVREEVRLERAWEVWVREELPKEFPGFRG